MRISGPKDRLIVMRYVALQYDPPASRFSGSSLGKVQACKWNAHQHDISKWGALAPCVPHGIKGEVGSILLAVKSIRLYAKSIGFEDECAALHVERIQQYLNVVVVA